MKTIIITITGFQPGRVYYIIGANEKECCAMAKSYKEFKAYFPDCKLILSNEYGEKMTVAEFNENIRYGL
jgi:hypothetical protein